MSELSVLSVFADSRLTAKGPTLEALQASTIEQLGQIQKTERLNATRATIIGLRLHLIKKARDHGTFGGWVEQHVPLGRRQVSYYMRLSVVAVARLGLKPKDLLAVLDGSLDAALTEDLSHPTLDKLRRFVGDCSITELLIKHNIRAVGLKGELTSGQPDALTEGQQLELAMERTWQESYESIERVREMLTTPEKLRLLADPQKLATLKSEVVEINRLLDERLAALRAVNV